MSLQVTVNLPDSLVSKAHALNASSQTVEEAVAETLEALYPMLENSPDLLTPAIATLPDAEVLAWADAKMDAVQNQRLGDLQAKGKMTGLKQAERHELIALFQIYQAGLLRKSEAMAEAVRRGLRQPQAT